MKDFSEDERIDGRSGAFDGLEIERWLRRPQIILSDCVNGRKGDERGGVESEKCVSPLLPSSAFHLWLLSAISSIPKRRHIDLFLRMK